MADIATFRIEIPEQGFDETYQPDEISQFFTAEQSYLSSISGLLRENVQWESRSYEGSNIFNTATHELREIKRHWDATDTKPLEAYVAAARRLEVVVGQGTIGKRVIDLVEANRKEDAKWLYYTFSSKWAGQQLNAILSPIRGALLGHPAFAAYGDVVSATQAAKVARESRNAADASAKRLETFIADKSKVIADLEELFRKKIPVEESAVYWKTAADNAFWQWAAWLGVFAVLTLAPIVVMLWNWDPIAAAVTRITSSNGGISLGGVAAITVPALLYGWLLKNISRMFIHRMALADDAAHRRVLTMTYLGLAKEPRLAITDNDRALILNALFRPIPPHSADDGPPAGLIDLIKKQ